jgi:hypothetical protein
MWTETHLGLPSLSHEILAEKKGKDTLKVQ